MSIIGHIEIAGTDGARLKEFYTGLFGWTIERRELAGFDYYDIETNEGPSASIRDEPDGKSEIVIYIDVGDVDRSVERAREMGANIRIPPMEYGDLRFALIEDPEGNPIGLTQKRG